MGRYKNLNGMVASISRIESVLLGFEVLTAVVMKSSVFWDITLCSPVEAVKHMLSHRFLLGLVFGPEDGGEMFLRNVG
jgi:hypothetical protein